MTMKLITASLLASLIAGPALAHGIDGREANQHRRIEHGVRHGSLTPRETHRLERREASIAAQEARMRAHHHGHLTRHDRHLLNKRLNRTSAAIWRDKHDGHNAY